MDNKHPVSNRNCLCASIISSYFRSYCNLNIYDMNTHTFNVKISEDAKGFMWYGAKKGQVFKVENYMKSCYLVTGSNKIIWKTDCEIVK